MRSSKLIFTGAWFCKTDNMTLLAFIFSLPSLNKEPQQNSFLCVQLHEKTLEREVLLSRSSTYLLKVHIEKFECKFLFPVSLQKSKSKYKVVR